MQSGLGAWIVEPSHPGFCQSHAALAARARASRAGRGAGFGPTRGARVTYVRLDQWLGALPELDGRAALQEVVRRYVRSYGPTTHVELARWLFTTPPKARELLESLGDELEVVDVDGWRAVEVVDALFFERRGARSTCCHASTATSSAAIHARS